MREERALRRQRGAGRGRARSAISGARRGSSRCGGARRDVGGGGGGAARQVGQRRSRVGWETGFAARRSEQGVVGLAGVPSLLCYPRALLSPGWSVGLEPFCLTAFSPEGGYRVKRCW